MSVLYEKDRGVIDFRSCDAEEVPFLQFHKTVEVTVPRMRSAPSTSDLHRLRERTVFIINAATMDSFFKDFALANRGPMPWDLIAEQEKTNAL